MLSILVVSVRSKFANKFAILSLETRHELNLPIDYQFHEVFFAQNYTELADHFQNFEVRPDDIWTCGLPKTGTVWMPNNAKETYNNNAKKNLDFNIPMEKVYEGYFEYSLFLEDSEDMIRMYSHRI